MIHTDETPTVTNLSRFRLTAAQTDRLMRDLVSQTLAELTDINNARYAVLQNAHNG
jgi:hypothetical protein